MTPRAAIAAALESAERHVAELRAALAAIDDAPIAPATKADEWVDIAIAEKITKVSRSQLRRWGAKCGVGEQTPTGQWRFHRAALLELATCKSERGANGAADGANGAGTAIHISVDQAHLELQHEE